MRPKLKKPGAGDDIHDVKAPERLTFTWKWEGEPMGSLPETLVTARVIGLMTMLENIGHPFGTFLYTCSTMHCMTVSLADGGMGLGTMWGEQTARRMLGEAGFTSVEAKRVDGDIVNAYIIATKG